MGKSHPEMGGGELHLPSGFPRTLPLRLYCLPGCERIDGHDGRDAGACMAGGTVLVPGPLDLMHRHPDIPVHTPVRASIGANWPPGAIQAFDLAPPAKLLGALIRCRDASYDIRELALGTGEDAPAITRTDYGACKAGCCEAHVSVELHVPCDSLPHCHSCECGSDHRFTLGEDVLRELKGFLP